MRKTFIIIISIALPLLLVFWVLWANVALECNGCSAKVKGLPSAFDGFRIAHVSDLHNSDVADSLLKSLRVQKPDIIAVTGDSIDCNRTDIGKALEFFKSAATIAPVYYVTGNHEAWIAPDTYAEYEKKLVDLGVRVLRNESVTLARGDKTITLVGIDDPEFTNVQYEGGIGETLRLPDLSLLMGDGTNILLAHRPEYFEEYADAGFDLVLSGHTHGGQFRIPFVGGVSAHGQGWFPRYDAGRFESGNTTMVISRGIGNSKIPVRINNRPELVMIQLHK